MTGAINEYGEALRQLAHEMRPASDAVAYANDGSETRDDATVIDLIHRDAALAALYRGDISAYGNDESRADQAFVNGVAPRTGYHFTQTERIWTGAPIGQRDKVQSRAAYRESTIRKAFDRSRDYPSIDLSGVNAQWQAHVARSQAPAASAPPSFFPPVSYVPAWPNPTPIGDAEWDGSQSSPPAVIPFLIYRDVGTLVAAGGTGKTTFFLWLAAHVALGIEFCGRPVVAPGNVVILTAEDSREMLVARLRKIVSEMFPFGARTIEDREAAMAAIRARIIILDVSASVQRLTLIDRDVVRVDTAAVDALAGVLGPLAPSLLVIDPAVSFGVGEARVNDAEQGLIEAARRLRTALGCAVFYVHHTGKANAREQTEDQYSGRGGSALPDGSRMVFVMNRPKATEWAKQTGYPLEPGETGLKINLAKLSYCEPQEPLYVIRKGYAFRYVASAAQTEGESEKNEEATVLRFLADERAKGISHSQKTLGDVRDRVGLSRDRLRSVVHRLIETEQLVERPEPGKSNSLIPATLADAHREGA